MMKQPPKRRRPYKKQIAFQGGNSIGVFSLKNIRNFFWKDQL